MPPRIEETAIVLATASDAVDPERVLQLLPDSIPLTAILPSLGAVVQSVVHQHRQALSETPAFLLMVLLPTNPSGQ